MEKMFLPISKQDIQKRGWSGVDFALVVGDAYIDHPSFGAALIGRVLEKHGYKVGIIAQPDVSSASDFQRFGKPNLCFLVTSGNVDSMVNRYTAAKKPRSEDVYSPGGQVGLRPNRAVIAYVNAIKRTYKDAAVIIGGLESSLRRFAHYDYWSESVRRSILFDSKADLLVYGPGERAILEIAQCLRNGIFAKQIRHVNGTCHIVSSLQGLPSHLQVPSYESIVSDQTLYAKCHRMIEKQLDPIRGQTIVQPHKDRFLVQNPPSMPLDGRALDEVYECDYMRTWHPIYDEKGGVPALSEVKFSITSSRGCFGDCSFCSLSFHQGRTVSSRTQKSIVEEARKLTQDPDFKGYIHDVGGPTANFYGAACSMMQRSGACENKRCMTPDVCPNMKPNHRAYAQLLHRIEQLPNVKKVFVRSGIRYDFILADKKTDFLGQLLQKHVSGQLKVAPEHVSDKVLACMRKPSSDRFDEFIKKVETIHTSMKKKQYILPYFISSHPGCTLHDAIELACYMKRHRIYPEQVQDFYPTPGTAATAMYYTSINPDTNEPVHVAKGEEKAMQRALLHFKDPKNEALIRRALKKAGREDLIGIGKNALVKP